MSNKLPSITPKKALRKLEKARFVENNQRGSHLVLIMIFTSKNLNFII